MVLLVNSFRRSFPSKNERCWFINPEGVACFHESSLQLLLQVFPGQLTGVQYYPKRSVVLILLLKIPEKYEYITRIIMYPPRNNLFPLERAI